ncbi:MAG: hypothetical protein ABSG79_25370 [Bryobacteraceae bacterium]
MLEEMVRKRIAGAECFIQLSFEAFAALASQGIVRGTKLKPFCEGLFRIVGLDNLGADLDLRRGRYPALRNVECIYDQRRDFSRRSTFVQQFNRPSQIENSLSSQNLVELAPAGPLFRHFHRVFPDPGSRHQGL